MPRTDVVVTFRVNCEALSWACDRLFSGASNRRLLVITGFMGGLTTFSTFSAEVVAMIGREEYLWAMSTAGLHLGGSLMLTVVGILTVKLLTGLPG